jgi:hypothetical protein
MGVYVGVHGGACLLGEKYRDTSVGSLGAKLAYFHGQSSRLPTASHISLPGPETETSKWAGDDGESTKVACTPRLAHCALSQHARATATPLIRANIYWLSVAIHVYNMIHISCACTH